jgi:hypothetical protein
MKNIITQYSGLVIPLRYNDKSKNINEAMIAGNTNTTAATRHIKHTLYKNFNVCFIVDLLKGL